MPSKKYFKNLIVRGKIGEALAEMMKTAEETGQDDLSNDLLLLSSRYNRNEAQLNRGVIDTRDYDLAINRIANTLNEYVDQLEIKEEEETSTATATATSVTDPAPDRFMALPAGKPKKIKYGEKAFREIESYSTQGLALIVTATDTETSALHQKMAPLPGEEGLLEVKKDNATYFLGKLGNFAIANVECGSMGSSASMGSILTVSNAISALQPKFVLMVGIAFGIDGAKQNIGDVLVSEHILPYEIQRAGSDQIIWRGSKPEASNTLRNNFKNLRGWEYTLPNGEEATLELCDILSGEKLIDNLNLRNQLVQQFPTAKGGEMEGAGLYAACQDKGVEWILIKSICDFADGNKGSGKKEKQALAIETALDACLHVFKKKYVFEALGLNALQED
ncbi:MAG: hypothetical protein SFV55_07510 [Haliscomenobacter sp.]|uniref:phosphorylase family protein n=1 Tax=Haliscomenobacter sp. TaxID=2717303 RepID=UPI0029A186F1|nr:hypothetical protein [Haliscomenobacter sp.]MDX2068257.1 hypothetical protein [Haliscomenobacter sp.]